MQVAVTKVAKAVDAKVTQLLQFGSGLVDKCSNLAQRNRDIVRRYRAYTPVGFRNMLPDRPERIPADRCFVQLARR